MNTTAAATQANVTVATVRAWCRRGVVAAVKVAGRWVIDSVSLAARIAIGARKRPARQETAPVIDLTATYTYNAPTPTGSEPTTITPTVKTRTRKTGFTWTTITGLAPLFADQLNAITDEGDRIHAAILLETSQITITDQIEDGPDEIVNGIAFLDRGRLRVKHQSTRQVPMDAVIDLARRIRTQLAA
ncbi:helix-turn-helix domain-containing protein [Streptomyces sp. NPDC057236]|uniref:helix-turn-helix domain-containing protein n=1 Tax=Streptomyces sp. NPDC057236 TaxID=3346059 RepID=UPI003632F18E